MSKIPSPDSDALPTILTLEGVTKRFPGVIANDSIDLEIRGGEVHVLLGENGAGKSTLIGMLSGLQQPDDGRILVDGSPTAISSPKQALSLGIGTVFQHAMLVPTLTVAENLLLGEPWWRSPKKHALQERVAELASSLGMDVDLDVLASQLSLGQQQFVEILRALLRDSRVLILDESTSMLTPSGVEELGALMRRLVDRGLAIVFITHKLREAALFGDRISVLKLGKKVGEIKPQAFQKLSEDELVGDIVEMMFGEQAGDPDALQPIKHEFPDDGSSMLRVRKISLSAGDADIGLNDISFDVRAGEIFGIAGIDGNGQKQLAEVLSGQSVGGAGEVILDGQSVETLSVSERRSMGLRYLTDDRLGEGTVATFPVSLNFMLKQVGENPFWVRGIKNRKKIKAHADQLIDDFDVRCPGSLTPVGRLSGGNIQKVLLARELAPGAKFVIFNKPTYGLDLANTIAIRQRIREIASAGMAVLLISTELDELLELSDRIGVMDAGAMSGIVENGDRARAEVGRLMIGLAA